MQNIPQVSFTLEDTCKPLTVLPQSTYGTQPIESSQILRLETSFIMN